jgi:hypothetical protein
LVGGELSGGNGFWRFERGWRGCGRLLLVCTQSFFAGELVGFALGGAADGSG